MGPGADLLRLDHHRDGTRRELVQERHHGVHQHGGQRFHALDGDAAGDLLQHVRGGRELGLQGRGAGHDGGRDQDFAARRGVEFGGMVQAGRGQRALVGDGEPAHLVHLVAKELDPDGVVLGGREDVQHAAADGEFAAAGHHVHPGVGGVGEALDDTAEGGLLADLQGHRHQFAEAGDDRLHDGADRGHHDAQRAGGGRFGVREPPQHGQPPAHGVRARGEPLVRQGLPAGELGDGVGRQEGAQGLGQVLGLAAGRGDGQDHGHRPACPGRAGFAVRRQRRESVRHFREQRGPQSGRGADLVVLAAGGEPAGGLGLDPGVVPVFGEDTAQTGERGAVEAHS